MEVFLQTVYEFLSHIYSLQMKVKSMWTSIQHTVSGIINNNINLKGDTQMEKLTCKPRNRTEWRRGASSSLVAPACDQPINQPLLEAGKGYVELSMGRQWISEGRGTPAAAGICRGEVLFRGCRGEVWLQSWVMFFFSWAGLGAQLGRPEPSPNSFLRMCWR